MRREHEGRAGDEGLTDRRQVSLVSPRRQALTPSCRPGAPTAGLGALLVPQRVPESGWGSWILEEGPGASSACHRSLGTPRLGPQEDGTYKGPRGLGRQGNRAEVRTGKGAGLSRSLGCRGPDRTPPRAPCLEGCHSPCPGTRPGAGAPCPTGQGRGGGGSTGWRGPWWNPLRLGERHPDPACSGALGLALEVGGREGEKDGGAGGGGRERRQHLPPWPR